MSKKEEYDIVLYRILDKEIHNRFDLHKYMSLKLIGQLSQQLYGQLSERLDRQLDMQLEIQTKERLNEANN